MILAPTAGTVVPITEAPDPVFAAEMVGSGVGIEPDQQPATVTAPIAGKVLKVHPHAFVILGSEAGVLVHLGIDTVKLEGEGFEVLATQGTTVQAGDEMVRWNPADVAARGLSPLVLVVAMDTKPGTVTSPAVGRHVAAGDELFEAPATGKKRKS